MSRQATSAHTDRQVLERFWAKVIRDPVSGCWVWTASKRNKGYGAFAYTVGDKMIQDRAHRFSWVIHNGEIPEGLCVLHRCDNPACVYPVHLFLGTKAINNADMLAKGRHVAACTYTCRGPDDPPGKHPKGEFHHNARLTPEIVRAIRADYASGLTCGAIAEKYGIVHQQASKIIRRKQWKHIL